MIKWRRCVFPPATLGGNGKVFLFVFSYYKEVHQTPRARRSLRFASRVVPVALNVQTG